MSVSGNQLNINASSMKDLSSTIISSLSNPKALIGLCLTLFGLYQLYTVIPESWGKLSASIDQVNQLEQNKSVVSQRLEQLRLTDKSLGEPSVKIYQLQPSQTPQLATLDLAQNIVKAAEETNNKLVSLTPREMKTVNFDKVVDIQIQVDTPPATPSTPEAVPPAAAPPPPAADPAAAGGNPQTAIQCAEFDMVLTGNVQSIVQFLYNLLDFKTAFFIEKINVIADASGVTSSSSSLAPKPARLPVIPPPKVVGDKSPNTAITKEPVTKPLNPNVQAQGNLTLDFTFLIPWKPVGSN